MMPLRYRVDSRREDTDDTVTLVLSPVDRPIAAPLPGQFTMVYAFGVGEVPISVSGRSGATGIVHTLRAVGAVTRALHAARPGDVLGVRGPYGVGWFLPAAGERRRSRVLAEPSTPDAAPPDADLVIMAGGIGLAPLRPVIRHAIEHRSRYRRVALLIGARTPGDLLYPDEYEHWRARGIDVRLTVDRAAAGWTGHVGVVTTLLDGSGVEPARTTAFVCGPEVMMRFAARDLTELGVPARAVQVSLERNMRCGAALCGHCQLGPLLLCRDGPVVRYDRAGPLMSVKEL